MKHTKAFSFVWIAFAVAISFAAFSPNAYAQKVHIVAAADLRGFEANGAQIQAGLKVDVKRFVDYFRDNLSADQLDVVEIDPQMVTKEAILDAIKGIKVEPDDVIIFYYTGHGAHYLKSLSNPDDYYTKLVGWEPVFQIRDKNGERDDLSRSVVRNALLARKARLTVMMTDSCNKISTPKRVIGSRSVGRRPGEAIELLFMRPKGVVDVNTSAPGEFSVTTGADALKSDDGGDNSSENNTFVNDRVGSLGTKAWLAVFDEIDEDPDESWNWDTFMKESGTLSDQYFQYYNTPMGPDAASKGATLIPQKTQTPYAYELPEE